MAETSSRCHCCVPHCKSHKQRQPYLSFHAFPSDLFERNRWVQAIRREEGPDFNILRGSTFVCSLHFDEAAYTPATGRKRLKIGAVPSRFLWNNCDRATTRDLDVRPDLSVEACRFENISSGVTLTAGHDHDYAVAPAPGALDAASVRIQELEAEVQKLEAELTQLKVGHLYFHTFCVSDEDIRFYTRFPSKEVFLVFWEAVQPSASKSVYWSEAQKKGQLFAPTSPSQVCRLQLIDEFFLYCCRVAAGLNEKMLADILQVSTTTVCRIVITWANYLYPLLGSLPIWMNSQQVKSTMPLKFKQYSPEVKVVIDCTEVQCQTPSSLTLQSEIFSSYKNTTTFKGLIGIAPCGAVTFVSSLYNSSISDGELTERCGILDLLEPGDGCLADKFGFTIEKMLADRGAKLIIPPHKTTSQFNKDALKRQAIARLQILAERAIRRIKEYHIWDNALPLSLSGTVNQLWTNCCLMTNFQGSLDVKGQIPVA